jgi:hypothetical protein
MRTSHTTHTLSHTRNQTGVARVTAPQTRKLSTDAVFRTANPVPTDAERFSGVPAKLYNAFFSTNKRYVTTIVVTAIVGGVIYDELFDFVWAANNKNKVRKSHSSRLHSFCCRACDCALLRRTRWTNIGRIVPCLLY